MIKKGDFVVMHTCLEADINKGRVWRVTSDEEFIGEGIYRKKAVSLDGYKKKFNVRHLQIIDKRYIK